MSSEQERLNAFSDLYNDSMTIGDVYPDSAQEAYANTHSDYEGQLGNRRDIPTVLESGGDRERCPYCGNWYKRIGSHWSQSSCEHPPISDYKIELLKGMMLGDGSLNFSNKYPLFDIAMTNVTFLKWLQMELGWLSGTFSIQKTASEIAQNDCERDFNTDVDGSHYLDYYRFYTTTHAQFEQFGQWYDTGEIIFPENLSVSPLSLKIWYVSDGCLSWSTDSTCYVVFSSQNESDRPGEIICALEKYGFTVGQSSENFRLSTSNTEDFFELIGDPVPGFEYKWAYQDRERYKRLKEQHREQHCTQTLE